ncbi:MAG: hypothetical protein IT574_06450 [Candidatus Aureabacteria bacterium]|nr:hypothetical protein [Candidatus Auribacterota bacterium]
MRLVLFGAAAAARAAGLRIGRRGVATGPTMQTSDPRVVAVGDAAVPAEYANATGRIRTEED